MDDNYQGQEQAIAKHAFLRGYLQGLAYKIGWQESTINYVDGFSGPWRSTDAQLRDTSPYIALLQLSQAQNNLIQSGRKPRFRCLFIEKNRAAYRRLPDLAARFPSIDVQTLHGEFEEFIPNIKEFVTSGGRDPFGFVFIDPKGWTGYGLSAITPLLNLRRIELLVNFMTKDILRFAGRGDPKIRASFADLFGREDFDQQWIHLTGRAREDAIVDGYCQRLREAGDFPFTGSSVILNPRQDRSHYHLVFATRSVIGLQVYREVESMSLGLQTSTRKHARQRARIASSGQQELFGPEDAFSSSYVEELMDEYQPRAAQYLQKRLSSPDLVPYKTLAGELMLFPMVTEQRVKACG